MTTFMPPGDALGGFVLTWPGSYKSLKVAGRRLKRIT
jgi:hypothetical protein